MQFHIVCLTLQVCVLQNCDSKDLGTGGHSNNAQNVHYETFTVVLCSATVLSCSLFYLVHDFTNRWNFYTEI